MPLVAEMSPDLARPAPTPPRAEVKAPDAKGFHRRGYKKAPPKFDESWHKTSDVFGAALADSGMHPERNHRMRREPTHELQYMQNKESIKAQYRMFMDGQLKRLIYVNKMDPSILRDPALALDNMMFDRYTKVVEKVLDDGTEVKDRIIDEEKLTALLSSSDGLILTTIVLEQEIVRLQFAAGLRAIADLSGARNDHLLGKDWRGGKDRHLTGHNQGVLNRLYHNTLGPRFQLKNLKGTVLLGGGGLTGFALSGGNPLGAAAGMGAMAGLSSLDKPGKEIDFDQHYGPGLQVIQNNAALSRFVNYAYHVNSGDYVVTRSGEVEYRPDSDGRIRLDSGRIIHSEDPKVSPPRALTDQIEGLITTRWAFFEAGHIPLEMVDATALQFLDDEGGADKLSRLRTGRQHRSSRSRRYHQPERTGTDWQAEINAKFKELGGFQYLPSPPAPANTPNRELNAENYIKAQSEIGIKYFEKLLKAEARSQEPGAKRITALDKQIEALGDNGEILKKRKEGHTKKLEGLRQDKGLLEGAGEKPVFEAWQAAEQAKKDARDKLTEYDSRLAPVDLDRTIFGLETNLKNIDDTEIVALGPDIGELRTELRETTTEITRLSKIKSSGPDDKTPEIISALVEDKKNIRTEIQSRIQEVKAEIIEKRKAEITKLTEIRDAINRTTEAVDPKTDTMKAVKEARDKIDADHALLTNEWGLSDADLANGNIDDLFDQIHTVHGKDNTKGWAKEEDGSEYNRKRLLHSILHAKSTLDDPELAVQTYENIIKGFDKNIEAEAYLEEHTSASAKDEIERRKIAKQMIEGRTRIDEWFEQVTDSVKLKPYVDIDPVDLTSKEESGRYFAAEKARYDKDGNPVPAGVIAGDALPKGYIKLMRAIFGYHEGERTDQDEVFAKIVKQFPPEKFAELINNYGDLPITLAPIGTPPRFDINEALGKIEDAYINNRVDKADIRMALRKVTYGYADELITSLAA